MHSTYAITHVQDYPELLLMMENPILNAVKRFTTKRDLHAYNSDSKARLVYGWSFEDQIENLQLLPLASF